MQPQRYRLQLTLAEVTGKAEELSTSNSNAKKEQFEHDRQHGDILTSIRLHQSDRLPDGAAMAAGDESSGV